MVIDPLLAAFAPVIGLILAGAACGVGGVALALRRRQPALVHEIRLRYQSWVVMAGLVLGALALGRAAWIALVGVLALVGLHEYARAVGLSGDRGLSAIVTALVVLIHVCAWGPVPDASPGPGWYGRFMAVPLGAVLALLAVPILRDQFAQMLEKVGRALLGVLCFGWLLGHLAYLVNLPNGVGLVLFLVFLVSLHDVAAFVTGKLLGRHRLRPALSPGKTWEGAAGGLLVLVATAWALRWLVPDYPVPHLFAVTGLVSVAATFGDLALSVLKRDVGIKDWSETIPGHGGILDRVNSLVVAAPIFFHYTRAVLA